LFIIFRVYPQTNPVDTAGKSSHCSAIGGDPAPVKPKGSFMIKPQDFGALANGIADDSSAIQAALNPLASNGPVPAIDVSCVFD
jgi:hypothetical protein